MVHVLLAALALQATVGPVSRAELGASWHPGCPVAPAQLRRVTVPYRGFDGKAHRGVLVVNVSVASTVGSIFERLFRERFPIRRMTPISAYGGSDDRSMAADDTSAFNCRYAVAPGARRWSVHAYGEAVDVNPVENPYLEGGRVLPTAGRRFRDRTDVRPGMALAGGTLVNAFAAGGWQWGGRWTASPDWQHFSATGG
jgi:hypothetical protein